MSKNLRRGVATLGVGALALTLAPFSSADVIDPDLPITIQPVAGASVYRIADRDRIGTAIEAAQSRNDWGRGATQLVWDCDGNNVTPFDGRPVNTNRWEEGDQIQVPVTLPNPTNNQVTCTAVTAPAGQQFMDIVVARSDDYADALAATPLADVIDAPVLINPTATLDARNAAEIRRLAGLRGNAFVTVHLLGGTNALSHDVENAIDAVQGVDLTLRYQGIDRYQTAVTLGAVTVQFYGIESGANIRNINPYVTTGVNFPDALAAGAAAAENDGIVLLTRGEQMDRRGFTEDFLTELNTWVNDDQGPWWLQDVNTTENFAVGGPAVRALRAADVRVAAEYDGRDRFETATLTASDTFDDPSNFAVVSGWNYPDAVVASAYIANSDGPLLLSDPKRLTPVTASYLSANVDNGDKVITFGGTGTLSVGVTQAIADLFNY